MGLQIYPKVFSKVIALKGHLRAVDTALAIAQYRLKHDGMLPGSLNELVPEFLDAVPIEPKSGKPFKLIKTADGFGIGVGAPVIKIHL